MELLEAVLGIYLAFAIFAVCMTRREQARVEPGLLDSLAYLACMLWPLPVMAMLIQQNLPRSGR